MKKKTNIKHNPKKKSNNKILFSAVIVVLVIVFIIYMVIPTKTINRRNFQQNPKSFESTIKFTKEGELTFSSKEGGYIVSIDVELADTYQKRMQGMMHRESMEELQGMFFVFPNEEPQSFWMRNTILSLDMLFVNSKFEIVKIHKATKTLSDQSYPSERPAIYVIEVNAGFTDKYSIKEGCKIVWRKI